MAYQTYTEKTLHAAVAQVMSFMAFTICEFGMKLALERELSDLKGAIDPDSFTGVEFELLENSDDPAIKMLVRSVESVEQSLSTFLMINNLDDQEVMGNQQGNELASEIFNSFLFSWDSEEYRNIMMDIHEMYFNLIHVLYVMGRIYMAGGGDIEDDDFKRFWNMDFDVLEELDQSDKNVSVIYDLIMDMNNGFNEVWDFI